MRILLDIDDTAMISKDYGKTWHEHVGLKKLLSEHTVILYSGNPDIYEYHKKWKTKSYIPKGIGDIPEADILIDNDADLWKETVKVKKCYKSIDAFLRFNKRRSKKIT